MALVTALMAMLMMLALGAGVAMTTLTEGAIAANHRDGLQALYAAEAGIDLAINRLRAVADWQTIVNGRDAVLLLDGRLVDLLQTGTVVSGIVVVVTVSPDPAGNDTLSLQSSATVPGGVRRTVQASVRKRPATEEVEIVSWR